MKRKQSESSNSSETRKTIFDGAGELTPGDPRICPWCCRPWFAHGWIVLFDQYVCGSAPMTDLVNVRRVYEYREELEKYAKRHDRQ